jgi:hypothetical protein
MTALRTLIVVGAAALITAACGGAGTPDAPGSTGAPQLSDQQAPTERVVIDVDIKDGHVTPTNQQMQAAVKQPILIRVNSDAADELHVHSSPEHTFAIEPRDLQSFQFTVDVPGRVDIELHDLNRTVATITVQ